MYYRTVRHYDKRFPVHGTYTGFYDGEPAVFFISNSEVMYVGLYCKSEYKPNKHKVEIIIKS